MPDAKTILVLGAGGGIGSALARRLSASGQHTILAGPASDRLAALGAELDAPVHAVDATVSGEVDGLFAAATAHAGALFGVAHCVGSLLLKPAHLTTDAEWAETLAKNLTSAFHVVRAAARSMPQGGSVVLVSSAAARHGLANHEAIAAAKAGVQGLMLAAAATYAPHGLRFNVVAPGLTRTPLTRRLTANEVAARGSLALHPLGRFGEADDVASLMAWLLDPDNDWVTGQVFGVDGGLATLRSR